MNDNWYDTAQICTRGHPINQVSRSEPEHNNDFCDKCGALTITNCQQCNSPIRGFYHQAHLSHWVVKYADFAPQSFCPDCGKPHPWTEAKLKAAQDLVNELDDLSLEERELLKKDFDDIIRDTPQATVAATRLKKLIIKLGKAGRPVAKALRDLFVDIASDTAKKIILEGQKGS